MIDDLWLAQTSAGTSLYCCEQDGEAVMAAVGSAAMRIELTAREARALGNWLLDAASNIESEKMKEIKREKVKR